MGLIRVLVLALLIYVVWRLIKSVTSRQRSATPPDTQRMLRCAHCGVHVPEHLALPHKDVHFCSSAHREAWLEQHGD
ncbi:MAG: hypothetical protein C0462_03720 [Alcanivorax sp.]|nr:hypothetical protein [Alcanivorax sp.]